MSNTFIEINVENFVNNLKAIRQHINDNNYKSLICLPVKANAYGHGIVKMSQFAAPYIDYFAVTNLDEGKLLRQNNITKPILVFGGFTEDEIPQLIEYNLEITISSTYKADLVANYCKAHRKNAKIHLKIDTGMNRIGIRPANAYNLIDHINSTKELDLVGIYSHFAESEDLSSSLTPKQIAEFTQVADYARKFNPAIIRHIANSAGLCYHPTSFFDMVRPGIISYGYAPNPQVPPKGALDKIKPCFTLKSKIIFFKIVGPGSGISYNHTYHTASTSHIITLPIGYGDGFRRILSNRAHVLINEKRYPICGNICMDMLMVDIGRDSAHIGDEAILIGSQGDHAISVEEIAQLCNTITYEIICSFTKRIPRIYSASLQAGLCQPI